MKKKIIEDEEVYNKILLQRELMKNIAKFKKNQNNSIKECNSMEYFVLEGQIRANFDILKALKKLIYKR